MMDRRSNLFYVLPMKNLFLRNLKASGSSFRPVTDREVHVQGRGGIDGGGKGCGVKGGGKG